MSWQHFRCLHSQSLGIAQRTIDCSTSSREFHEISGARSVSACWLSQEAPVCQGSSNKLKHHPVLIQSQFLQNTKTQKRHPPMKPCIQPFLTTPFQLRASSKSGTCLLTAAYKNFLASSFFFLYSSLFLGSLSLIPHRRKKQ